MESRRTDFRLMSMLPAGAPPILRLLSPAIDRLLGLHRLQKIFENNRLEGMEKNSFVSSVIKVLKIRFGYRQEELERIPAGGPAIIAANHPFGGAEGILLCSLLSVVRPDFKVLANFLLSTIREMKDFFIPTNSLKKWDGRNISALRSCHEWVRSGHLLVVFPAGRVAFHQRSVGEVSDGPWNRFAAKLALRTGANVIPVHFSGSNSSLYHFLGGIYYRFRLLMLPRELLNMRKKKVQIEIGTLIRNSDLTRFAGSPEVTRYLRMRTFLISAENRTHGEQARSGIKAEEVIEPRNREVLTSEIAALPAEHLLFSSPPYRVYYAYYDQIPETVVEIGRLREETFRILEEGSGRKVDLDLFDRTYTHLFIWEENERRVIGAYRMGETERLLNRKDRSRLYLNQIFQYTDEFLDSLRPGLEMGRSFLRADHQKSMLGLSLLWRGIGRFLVRKPDIHTLFGTVSISRVYSPLSMALMFKALIGDGGAPRPRNPFSVPLPGEVDLYLDKNSISMTELSNLVRSVQPDGMDVPVLVKQYARLGARFLSVALDHNFSRTPGVFLKVDMRKAPARVLKLYLGKDYPDYLKHHSLQVPEPVSFQSREEPEEEPALPL